MNDGLYTFVVGVYCGAVLAYFGGRWLAAREREGADLRARVWELEARERERARPTRKPAEASA